MIGVAVLFAQLVAPAAVEHLPDIEVRAGARAERVDVKQQGEAKIELRVEPGGTGPVRVERSAPAGQRSYRNLNIDFRAAARIADPAASQTASASDAPTGEHE